MAETKPSEKIYTIRIHGTSQSCHPPKPVSSAITELVSRLKHDDPSTARVAATALIKNEGQKTGKESSIQVTLCSLSIALHRRVLS
ncbi:MAG: hypothetical protein RBT62_08410 [Spirochaetia bacterium]|nr:hypothetical protein [Spirochaetia bacterium]